VGCIFIGKEPEDKLKGVNLSKLEEKRCEII